MRRRFWSGLIELARARGASHGNLSPSRSSWIGTGSGTSGLAFNHVVWQHSAAAELYIDRGDSDENKRIFDELAQDRVAIEAVAGELQWIGLMPSVRRASVRG